MTATTLYRCKVFHQRNVPIQRSFTYGLFMFCLDLDQVLAGARTSWLCGLYRFVPSDHLREGPGTIRQKVSELLEAAGLNKEPARIRLVTHVRTFGYVFNPVCFFFCEDADGAVEAVIAEVTNTFHEKKAFVVPTSGQGKGTAHLKVVKNFYVSPFSKLDLWFDFRIQALTNRLVAQIDDWDPATDTRPLITYIHGEQSKLSAGRLLLLTLRYPWVPLLGMARIHWQAFLTWFRRVPYIKKNLNLEQQTEIIRRRGNAHF